MVPMKSATRCAFRNSFDAEARGLRVRDASTWAQPGKTGVALVAASGLTTGGAPKLPATSNGTKPVVPGMVPNVCGMRQPLCTGPSGAGKAFTDSRASA
jgi:hypothetical protein